MKIFRELLIMNLIEVEKKKKEILYNSIMEKSWSSTTRFSRFKILIQKEKSKRDL
jgi:hypothetical protein